LIDSLPEHVYVKDAEGRYILNNAQHVKDLGAASPEEVAGKSDFDFYARELAEQYRADEHEIIRSGRPLIGKEEPCMDEEGNSTWHSTTKVPLRDGDGKIVGIVGTSRDITERKRAEEALKASEERYRTVIEQTADAIFLVDGHTRRILESNARFQELLCYTPEQLGEMTLYDIVAHDRESIDRNAQRIMEKDSHELGERSYRREDGSLLDVEVSVNLIDYDGREVMCCVARDITERKQAEEKLRESERRFRSLIQNASDLITILEEDGTIRYKSPSVERILGYSDEQIIDTNVFDYIHPEDVQYVKRTFESNLERVGVHPPVQFRFRHADGSWRYIEAVRNNLLEDPGVRGIVVNTRDITERKEAEEALKESEERYRAVVEQSVEGIWLFDPDTKQVLESNTAFQEMLGYTAQELQEMTNYDFVAHSREDIDSAVQHVLQERRGFFGERKYRRKDWMVLDVEVSGAVIPYRGKEVLCGVAVT
jgi:PAS domain S-box-containing protein